MTDHFLLLHQLWRSLCRGDKSNNRPALPTELVDMIFRVSDDLHVPIHVLNLSTHFSKTRIVSGFFSPQKLLTTRGLTASLVHALRKHLVRLDIGITSCARPSCSAFVPPEFWENRSWFDIALYNNRTANGDNGRNMLLLFSNFRTDEVREPQQMVIERDNDKERLIRWRVHANERAGEDFEFKKVTVTLGQEHEIWKWVEVEDRICLIASGEFPTTNDVLALSFRFVKYFEPVV